MNGLLRYFIPLILLLCTRCLCAQVQKSRGKIETFDSLLTIKITQNSDIEKLSLRNGNNSIMLSPNVTPSTRINISYRYLSFGFSFAPSFLKDRDNKSLKGATKIRGLGAGFNFRHWQQTASYSRTKGYYLENTADYRSAWQAGDPFLQFPDLVFKQYQGSTAYSFNPGFSANAVATQTERQTESAGSFIPMFTYRYYITDDRSLPAPDNFTQKARSLELLLGPGYYYTWVLGRNCYASLGITGLAGVAFTSIENRSANTHIVGRQRNSVIRGDGSLGLGYNGHRFFSGIYVRGLATRFKQSHTPVVNMDNRMMGHLSLGYRFNAPDLIKKTLLQSDRKMEELRNKLQKSSRK